MNLWRTRKRRQAPLQPHPPVLAEPNKFNEYVCPKGHKTVTLDIHEGVTPFIISCRHCGDRKIARSSFYRTTETEHEAEWFMPWKGSREYKENREHCDKGGLILRYIEKDAPPKAPPSPSPPLGFLDAEKAPPPNRKMVRVFAPNAIEGKFQTAAYDPSRRCWFGEDGYPIKQLNSDGWTENAVVTHWRPL